MYFSKLKKRLDFIGIYFYYIRYINLLFDTKSFSYIAIETKHIGGLIDEIRTF